MTEEKREEITLEELRQKLEECQKQKSDYLAGWQRSRADFLNYQKEEMERIGELLKYANTELILKILPILDNFDIIGKKLPENLNNNEYIKGFFQIKTQLQDFLKNQGIEEIKSIGEKFNPNFHEVVEETENSSPMAREPGIIVEEIQKGYKINGRLLRPARVKISK